MAEDISYSGSDIIYPDDDNLNPPQGYTKTIGADGRIQFVPSPPSRSYSASQSSMKSGSANPLGDTLQDLGNELVRKAGDYLLYKVEQKTDEAFQTVSKWAGSTFVKVVKGTDITDGGGDGGRRGPSGGGSFQPTSHLDYNPNPIRITIDSGIKPNTYSPFYHDAIKDKTSFLHMSSVKLRFPSNDSRLDEYFTVVQANNIYNRLQAAVTFSVPYPPVNPSNLRGAFNALMDAMQIYFFYDSILAYCSSPENRNEGMRYLRSKITASDINDLSNLRMILRGTPIPPNMYRICHYMFQVYSSSPMPGSSLLFLTPLQFQNNLEKPVNGAIYNAITNLQQYNQTFSLIARACRNWINPDMKGSSVEPFYDPQFVTLFSNLPFESLYAGLLQRGPSIEGTTQPISYNAYTNDLDGIIYGLTSIYSGELDSWLPSMLEPVLSVTGDNSGTSRFSWYFDENNNKAFVDTYLVDSLPLAITRGETYIWNSVHSDHFQNFAAEFCEAVTPQTVTQTSFSLLDWIISLDTIPVKSSMQSTNPSNNSGSQKSNRKKSRGGKSKRNKMSDNKGE